MKDELDLDNPEWLTAAEQMLTSPAVEDGSNPHVRTNSNALSFLHGIEDHLEKWWQHEVEHGREPHNTLPEWLKKNLPVRQNKVEVSADVNPATSFSCQTYTIPAQATQQQAVLVSNRSDRQRAYLLNTGANPAYFGHQTDTNTATPNNADMDWCLLPVNAPMPRKLQAQGRVYVFSPLGSTVDIQEEYGYLYPPDRTDTFR
jgi:hypothetical protein